MDVKLSTTKLLKLMFMFVFLCSGHDFPFSEAAADEQVILMCKDEEREALLNVKQGFTDPYDSLSSWGSSKPCCNWVGVHCSNTTGHVIGLQLSTLQGEIRPALLELHHLSSLNISYNDFGGVEIPEFIGSLQKLEYLLLWGDNFSGDVPPQLGNLRNLRELDLSYNHLTSNDFTWVSNLSFLSKLQLSMNRFRGPVPLLSNLTLLSNLDLSLNHFQGPFPDLKSFSSLRELHLRFNNLTYELPTSINRFTSLEILDVSKNSLEGTVSEVHLSKLHTLKYLDLSGNSLVLNLTSEWIPPFQLDSIYLAECQIGPHFPTWLRTQRSFTHLHLSSNGITGELPNWFWNLSDQLALLDLSHNQFSGSLLDLTPYFYSDFPQIDISFNNFSGPLPLFPPNSSELWLSNNMFTGSIQSLCKVVQYDNLELLDLSNNQFSGELPTCWENMPFLFVFILNDNKFSGHIPQSLGFLSYLRNLQFRNNKLTGELPSTLKNCNNLLLLDGGGNDLTGNIPVWMGTLTNLSILSLRQNNFTGNIPPEICHLTMIQVLDLSENNISGRIPRCFNNFTSLIMTNRPTKILVSERRLQFGNFLYNAVVQWKRQESEYKNTLQFLKLIDLSSNKFVGDIPQEVFHLAGLLSLNLSQNLLTGNINPNISEMKMLECLDLSRNKLSGEIPISLAELQYLAILDLSSNNLSGKIPSGPQLQSFNASAYAGNRNLCGEPLPKCAGDSRSSDTHGNEGDIDDRRDKGSTTIQSLFLEYFISAVMGYIVGFWVIIGPLLYRRSWRDAYFGYLSKTGDWLYVTTNICCRRSMRYMKNRKH